MSSTARRRAPWVLALVLVVSVLVPTAASAAKGAGGGGGGGGGTTTTTGVIKSKVSTAAACDNGSSIGLTVEKGRGSSIQEVLAFNSPNAGWWSFRLVDDASARLLIGFGGTRNAGSSLITVATNATLPVGTWALTFTGVLTEGTATGALLETCTAHVTVVVA